jgi:HAD superfamily hydrolase (TIGR01549 family)
MFAVIFDLEGTLVRSPADSHDVIREFRLKTREKLVELGIPLDVLRGSDESANIVRNRALEYVEDHLSKTEAKRFHREIDKFLKEYELDWANNSMPFPDTISILCDLKTRKFRIGLVTNTSREAAERMLSMHQLLGFFDVIVTREDVKRIKPDPEGISIALKKLGTEDFFFVGDLEHDSIAAKGAGGISIILNKGSSSKKFHADYFVRSLSEIPAIIRSGTPTSTSGTWSI